MITSAAKIIQREIALARSAPAQWTEPLIYLLLTSLCPAMLVGDQMRQYPLVCACWVALGLVLSSLLTLDRALYKEYHSGLYSHWLLAREPMWWLMFAKSMAHWLVWVLPMVIASPLAMLMLGMSGDQILALFLALLIGSPVISFVGIMSNSLVLNIHTSGFLLALIMIPLILPMLLLSLSPIQSIMISQSGLASYSLLAAFSILCCTFCPIASAFGIRVSQSCGNI